MRFDPGPCLCSEPVSRPRRSSIEVRSPYDVAGMKAYVGTTDLRIESIDDDVSSVTLDPGFKVTLFESGDVTGFE